MGVPGLWDVLRSAGHTRSTTHLSVVDGFDFNSNGLRGYRVGVDAFIWIFHSKWGREGENPQLRTIMFRIVKLINSPFLPLFVFDGPGRPGEKRGKKIQKRRAPALVDGIKRLIAAFGLEWRTAPGEAEAELAYLNSIGTIDGIISDDVDAFLFGAKVIIRNPSATLSGNKPHKNVNKSGKQDGLHTTIYRAGDILEHPDIQLCQGGLILFALLSGGDYHVAGLKGCGRGTAHALARCGLGHKLFVAARTLPVGELKNVFLPTWREELRHELRTDSHGYLGRKCPSLAKSVSDDFPDIDVLLCYTNPLTTEVIARGRNKEEISWNNDPSPAKIAAACEQFFEWGYEEMMLHRFRKWLWTPLVCRMLRRNALRGDREALSIQPTRHSENLTDTPGGRVAKQFTSLALAGCRNCDQEDANEKLVVKIHGQRTHVSTDLLEYRLEINPTSLVRQCRQGILGTRSKPEKDEVYAQDDGQDLAASSNPNEHLRVWMPASMVKLAEPNLVTEWEDSGQRKSGKSLAKGRARSIAVNNNSDNERPKFHPQHSNPLPSKKRKAKSDGNFADMKDFFVATKRHTGTTPVSAPSQASMRNRANSPPISTSPAVSASEPTTLEVLLSISSQEAPKLKLPSFSGSPRVDATHRESNDWEINSERRSVSPSLLGETSKSMLSKSHSRRDGQYVIDIIEISSDSDMPSTLKLPIPKRRVKKGASNNACTSAASQGEIIDLT